MKIAVILKEFPSRTMEVGMYPELLERLRSMLPDDEVAYTSAKDGAPLIETGFDAEVLITAGIGTRLAQSGYCKFAKSLKWIHNTLAGTEVIFADPYIASHPEIAVTNSRGVHSIQMTEHVMGYILCFARNHEGFRRQQLEGGWARLPTKELYGATLGIIGVGTIGSEIAARGKAFGMHVLGAKRNPGQVPNVDEMFTTAEGINEVVSRADYLVLITPGGPKTEKLMNADRFAKMKPGSVFINIARGSCVDEAALTAALKEGRPGAAALDVFETEPLPEDSPLRRMENVLITPHVAGSSFSYMEKVLDVFMDNMRCYKAGRELPTRVFPE